MENENYKSRYYLMLGISVLCLVFLVGSASYAFFRPIIKGEGSPIDVISGKVKLQISESKINAANLTPIKDTSKDTKAQKNDFTISRTDESNLNACYSLYLVVDSIGESLKNKWLKYELSYTDSNGQPQSVEGNFENFNSLTLDKDGKTNVGLLVNQELSNDNPSNSYTLKLWLSYSLTEDQSSILTGTPDSRTFSAHIYASGESGKCKVTN